MTRSPSPQKVSLSPEERRQSRRRHINRTAKIQLASGALPLDCIITDISEGGVRLDIKGLDVPDDFVLLLAGDGATCNEFAYRVVWRLGHEIGARFVGTWRRSSATARN